MSSRALLSAISMGALLALAPMGPQAQVVLTPASPAASQAPGSLVDPDAVLVEELVVTARDPGPAWWRVSNGSSTVYVLGVPSVAPKQLAWDRSTLERRLKGANELIVTVDPVKVKLAGAPGAMFSYMKLRSGKPFEETLSEPLRGRFVKVREDLGQPAKRYATGNALAASLMLIEDYRDHARLTATDPSKPIRQLARSQKIKVDEKTYDAGSLLSAVARTPRQAALGCLDEALDEAQAGPGAVKRAALAWANGDVHGALAAERTYERCVAAAPGALKLDARFKADQAAAIAQALKRPGHAVAVVQLRPLLSQGGVLDRLRAQGLEVKTPGDA
jgi:uncharacterized protein YbaP (TraB family)